MSNLIIPGNVKQQYVPFVLDPNNDLHGENDQAGSPQHFTFKDKEQKSGDGATKFGVINIAPSSYKKYFNKDLSNQLLYKRNPGAKGKDGKELNGGELTYQDLLNSLPVIQIREFLPDSKLDQCINFFGDLVKSIGGIFKTPMTSAVDTAKDATNNGTQTSNPDQKEKNSGFPFKRLLSTIWYAIQYIIGIGEGHGSLVGSLFTDGQDSARNQHIYFKDQGGKNMNVKVTDFPYAFYYRMQSCTTTNIYEVPGVVKVLYDAKGGSVGWEGSGDWDRGFNIGAMIDKSKAGAALKGIGKTIFGNIGVQWSPWWDPIKGTGTKEDEVTITFNLFNDTADSAMNNFIFVNTLIPNNRWIQYGLFQHSGAVYDVKLEGYNRLFFCTGNFSVEMEGVLRDPPEKWIDNLCDQHSNNKEKNKRRLNPETLKNVIKNQKAIKIPDVYKVTMTFQSQLPQNFNTWLFNYSHNFDNFTEYGLNKHYDPSFISTALPKAIKELGSAVATYYKTWDESKTNPLLNATNVEE